MKKYYLLTIICFLVFCFKVKAQVYEVPKDYTLKTKEDYAKYESDVINTVDWLQQTSWDELSEKRKEANTFLMAWLTGSPNVNISIGKPLMDLVEKNNELLMIFMGEYAKYTLQHKDAPSNNDANIFGLRAIIDKYNREKSRVKNKAMERLIKLDQEGKLQEWASKDFIKS